MCELGPAAACTAQECCLHEGDVVLGRAPSRGIGDRLGPSGRRVEPVVAPHACESDRIGEAPVEAKALVLPVHGAVEVSGVVRVLAGDRVHLGRACTDLPRGSGVPCVTVGHWRWGTSVDQHAAARCALKGPHFGVLLWYDLHLRHRSPQIVHVVGERRRRDLHRPQIWDVRHNCGRPKEVEEEEEEEEERHQNNVLVTRVVLRVSFAFLK